MLISLCLLGLARSAPQFGQLGVPQGFSSAGNTNAIVTDVVGALQPQIAAAVAEALRGLSLSGSRNTNSNSASVSGSSSSSGLSSSTGFANGGSFNQQEEVTASPNYAYEFKIADDTEQTYITHNEARDGNDVTGTYSYVDPTGALITVNYEAGVMGYTQTMDRQEGAVSIRSKAKSSNSATSATASTSSTSSSNSNSNTVSSTSAVDESDLIARILSALQPQISSAVNSAISSSQQSTTFTNNRAVTSNTGFAAGGDRFTPLFGN